MAWNASVTNKQLIGGIVHVTVEYTDGVEAVPETYRARMPQVGWIPDTVRDRIKQLDAASAYTIPIGPVTPSDDPPVADPDIALFRRRCRLLEIVKVMIDLGAVEPDNLKVEQLINWIKDNVADYFDTLDA